MTFNAVFRRAIPPVFDKVPSAAVTSWWLSGGIAAANCVAAYQPKGAASLAASYINLASPGTYNAAPGTAPAFTAATGWQFTNASSQYLTTGIIPGGTWTFAIRYSDAVQGAYSAFGLFEGVNTKRINFYPDISAAVKTSAQYGSLGISHGSTVSTGIGTFYRSSSDAKLYLYIDGVFSGSTAATTWVDPSIALFIGARNNSGTADQFASVKIQALAAYNTNLTDPQIAALTTAMNAL